MKIKYSLIAICIAIILLVNVSRIEGASCNLGQCILNFNDCTEISKATRIQFDYCPESNFVSSFFSWIPFPFFNRERVSEKIQCCSNKKCPADFEGGYYCQEQKIMYKEYTFKQKTSGTGCIGTITYVEADDCDNGKMSFSCYCILGSISNSKDMSVCKLVTKKGKCFEGECSDGEESETYNRICSNRCETDETKADYGHCV